MKGGAPPPSPAPSSTTRVDLSQIQLVQEELDRPKVTYTHEVRDWQCYGTVTSAIRHSLLYGGHAIWSRTCSGVVDTPFGEEGEKQAVVLSGDKQTITVTITTVEETPFSGLGWSESDHVEVYSVLELIRKKFGSTPPGKPTGRSQL